MDLLDAFIELYLLSNLDLTNFITFIILTTDKRVSI